MLTISAFPFSSAEAYKQGMAEGQQPRLGIKSERRENEQRREHKNWRRNKGEKENNEKK